MKTPKGENYLKKLIALAERPMFVFSNTDKHKYNFERLYKELLNYSMILNRKDLKLIYETLYMFDLLWYGKLSYQEKHVLTAKFCLRLEKIVSLGRKYYRNI